MATSLDEVIGFLENQEMRYEETEQRILTAFGTQQYIDDEGDKLLKMVISLEEEGEFLKIYSPSCYQYNGEEHRLAVMQTLLMVGWKSKMVKFEYDSTDGEIRAVIEFPIEDSLLTEKQLMRAVIALVQIVDHYHPVIFKAIEDGEIDFSLVEDEEEMAARMVELLEQSKREMEEEEEKEEEEEEPNDSGADEDSDDFDEFI